MNPKVDFYFAKNQRWQQELEHLRTLVLDCGLAEVLKWGVPCYTVEQRNIVLLHAFKGYCALLFIKGALLQDEHGLLVQQTENSQTTRQIRFTNVQQVVDLEPVLKAYVQEAVALEKAGRKVAFKTPAEHSIPAEFRQALAETPGLQAVFHALTPGRQRGYLLYFAAAKQASTRAARVQKCLPRILRGQSLNDEAV